MRTIVGFFDSLRDAESAVTDLEAVGFRRDDISIMTHHGALEKDDVSATSAGTAIGTGLGLLAGLSAVVVPGVGVIAALGPIIAGGILGAVAGGLVGSLMDAGVPATEAEHYAEAIKRGGTLLVFSVSDDDAARAIEIMDRRHAVNLTERVAQWGVSPIQPDVPDPTGQTTMGDAAAAMPAPLMAIPAPGIQPTHIHS